MAGPGEFIGNYYIKISSIYDYKYKNGKLCVLKSKATFSDGIKINNWDPPEKTLSIKITGNKADVYEFSRKETEALLKDASDMFAQMEPDAKNRKKIPNKHLETWVKLSPKSSPLDVTGVDLGISAAEIVASVREGREKF